MKKDNLSQQDIQKMFGAKPKSQSAPEREEFKPIRVHNLPELKKLVKRLQPGPDDKASPIIIDTKKARMADDTYSGMVTIPQSGGQSTVRRTLLDGFEMLKQSQKRYEESLATQNMEEEYGGFLPAVVPNPTEHHTWVDTFIDRNMGGKREGLYIVWNLPEGKFRMDPWTCKLEKVDAS